MLVLKIGFDVNLTSAIDNIDLFNVIIASGSSDKWSETLKECITLI